jgi:hypothetical protein
MATDKDLELLDDYLSNKLEGAERADFEKRLEADESLRNELAIQNELIEGLKSARIAELKSMLNQAIIPPATGSSIAGKVTAWVLAATVVGFGTYYLLRDSTDTPVTNEPVTVTEDAGAVVEEPQADIDHEAADAGDTESETVPEAGEGEPQAEEQATKEKPAAIQPGEEKQNVSPVIQPEVSPYDPTKELESANGRPEPVDELGNAHASGSSIVVEVDNSDRKYDFHYRFTEGKLFLLGSFEKDLYEILEFFNDNKRTLFLYYQSGFYLLDESKEEPTALNAITDPELLQKLRNYRNK